MRIKRLKTKTEKQRTAYMDRHLKNGTRVEVTIKITNFNDCDEAETREILSRKGRLISVKAKKSKRII